MRKMLEQTRCAVLSALFASAVAMVGGCTADIQGQISAIISQETSSNVAQSSKVRDANPQASDADVAAVMAGNTDFALKAFPVLDTDANKNVVFSPYSVTLALALTAAGAKGTTLTGIEQALSFSLSQDRLNPAFNKLDLLLASKTTGTVDQDGFQYPKLNIVNAIWGQEGFSIQPSYLDTIATNFGANLRLLDYIGAPEVSRKAINSWVEQKTNNRIKDLIPSGAIDTLTRFVLTNAIWFKANWQSQFSVSATQDKTFSNRDGSTVAVPFMRQTIYLSYAQSDGCQAIDMPYVGGQLSMLVLMPDPGTFDEYLSTLTAFKIKNITALLSSKYIELSLPKFTFSAMPDIGTIVKGLGMTDAFDPLKADFSGIAGQSDLFITSIEHQAFISVDEEGTEAAAATAVIGGTTSAPPPPMVLNIDHPFIFMIRDRDTGLVLFIGKVVALHKS